MRQSIERVTSESPLELTEILSYAVQDSLSTLPLTAALSKHFVNPSVRSSERVIALRT